VEPISPDLDPVLLQVPRSPAGRGARIVSKARGLSAGAGLTSLMFAAGFVLPRAVSLLTVPVYTRLLGVEEFGRFELLTSVFSLLYVIALLGMDFAISVRFFGLAAGDRRGDASTALLTTGSASLFGVAVLVALAPVLGPLMLQTSDGALPFAITVVALPFNVLGSVLAICLRLHFRGGSYLAAFAGGAAGGGLTGIVLVLALNAGLLGALVGFGLIHAITFALLAAAARDQFSPALWDRGRARQLLRIGLPLVPANASSWVFAVADRFFVSAFVGFTQLGLYAAAARIGMILTLAQYGFHAAWGPVALRWGAAPDRDARYAASLRLVAVAGGASTALVSWLAWPLLWVLAGPSYVSAAGAVWLLASSALFLAMFYVVQIGASLAQRGDRVAWATLAAAAANTVANLALIPPFGFMGAAWATLVAYVVAYGVMYALSQGVCAIDFAFRRSTSWALGWTVLGWASTMVPAEVAAIATAAMVVLCVTTIGLAVTSTARRLREPGRIGGTGPT
jgi:O-antigen/teichoic acid export membrane protein